MTRCRATHRSTAGEVSKHDLERRCARAARASAGYLYALPLQDLADSIASGKPSCTQPRRSLQVDMPGVYAGTAQAQLAPVAVTTVPAPGVNGNNAYGRSVTIRRSQCTNDDDPCEFKIVVLQALFQTDLQRGIMAATEWLKPGSTQTVRCKSAALTLLGRNGGKAVTPVILGVARNESDLKLRARAISTLGATNDDSVIDALRDFALNSQETDIVEASRVCLEQTHRRARDRSAQ